MWRNNPEGLLPSLVQGSGDPFDSRPWALSVPQKFSGVSPSDGQLQLPTLADLALNSQRSRLTSVSLAGLRVPSDNSIAYGSEALPCRFSDTGGGESCNVAPWAAYIKLPVKCGASEIRASIEPVGHAGVVPEHPEGVSGFAHR